MNNSKKQKEIICTVGPVSSATDVLLDMARAGMTMIRINCSHYDPASAQQLISFLRQQQPQVRILVDLQGPRLRVASQFPEKLVRENQIVQFVSDVNYVAPRRKEAVMIPLTVDWPFVSLASATQIFMKDGTMAFEVSENRASEGYILAKTRWGGPVRGGKAVNVPGLPPAPSPLTTKDLADLRFAAANRVDAVMLSFVGKAKDMQELAAAWKRLGASGTPEFWAKIETKEGIQNLADTCRYADAILIGRGDLAVDVGPLEAPAAQSHILETAQQAKVRCMVATQVLESMRINPYPSRAELRDIYWSLREGAAGFMLTAETSVGRYPVQAIGVLGDMIRKYPTSQPAPAVKTRRRRNSVQ